MAQSNLPGRSVPVPLAGREFGDGERVYLAFLSTILSGGHLRASVGDLLRLRHIPSVPTVQSAGESAVRPGEDHAGHQASGHQSTARSVRRQLLRGQVAGVEGV